MCFDVIIDGIKFNNYPKICHLALGETAESWRQPPPSPSLSPLKQVMRLSWERYPLYNQRKRTSLPGKMESLGEASEQTNLAVFLPVTAIRTHLLYSIRLPHNHLLFSKPSPKHTCFFVSFGPHLLINLPMYVMYVQHICMLFLRSQTFAFGTSALNLVMEKKDVSFSLTVLAWIQAHRLGMWVKTDSPSFKRQWRK